MDEFEKNNELENEAQSPEPEEELTVTDITGESAEAQETAEAEEAQAAEEAQELPAETPEEDASYTEDSEPVPEESEYSPEDGEAVPEDADSMLEGGDMQPCDDVPEGEAPDGEITEDGYGEEALEEEVPEEENIEDIPEEELCKRCYARRRDDSVEGFEYCSVCVEEMAATKVSFGAFFYLFITTLSFVLAAVYVFVGFYIAKPIMKTAPLIKQHRLSQAMEQFNTAEKRASDLNSRLPQRESEIILFETGTNTLKKYVKLLNTVAGPINAYQVIESSESLDPDKPPADLKAICNEYKELKETDNLVYEMFQEYQKEVGDDGLPNYNVLVERLDKIYSENQNIYKPLMEYYKYYAAKISNVGTDIQIGHLKKVQDQYPDKAWLYLSPILDLYYSSEDYGNAIACCNKVLEININDSSAMIYKARSLYLQGKTDKVEEMVKLLEKNGTDEGKIAAFKAELKRRDSKFDEAIAICDDMLKNDKSSGEAYRQKAIALMLKGDMKQAHEVLKTAYDQADLSVELVEMLAISSSKTGDTDTLKEVQELLTYNGLSFSEKAQACIDGRLTLEQIFMEGQGDL